MTSIQKLTSIDELFNHTDVKKLIVFRYLNENGNSKNNNYEESNLLGNNDVEKINIDILNVNIENESENIPKSFIIVDAVTNYIYNICFYEIPSSYTFVIKYINNEKHLIIYQKYLTA